MSQTQGFTEDLARFYVDFIDDLYAEQALQKTGARMAMFYAHQRLDGAFTLACLVEPEEGNATSAAIAVLNAARERYAALMQGAGVETESLRQDHIRVIAEVRRRLADRGYVPSELVN